MGPEADNPTGPAGEGPAPQPQRRRKRYRGTHPRRFEERYKELRPVAYPEIHEHIRSQGRTPAGTHVPVMVRQVMECLAPGSGEVVADCTVGYAGHAAEFLRRIGPAGRLVGLDLDEIALDLARPRLAELGFPFSLHAMNFAGLPNVMAAERIDGFDAIFADLGASSMQLDDPHRGFSYKHAGPLDMRMGGRVRRTAAGLLAELAADELEALFRDLGDEPDAAAIARRIVQARRSAPIAATGQLTALVLETKGLGRKWRGATGDEPAALHPAARVFQALRIAVNGELENLAQLLRLAPYCLHAGGRIAILSFHSGEDRLVKHAFREGLRMGTYGAVAEEVIRPDRQEVHDNPRSSPARLRWARKP